MTRDQAGGRLVDAGLAREQRHLLHIYEKPGVRDRAAAVGEAYRRPLLP